MNSRPKYSADSEVDLAQMLMLLWRKRWLIAALTTLSAAGGVAYSLCAQSWWRAELVMAQADSKQLPSGLSQLGGLASLAGVNVGSFGGTQNAVAIIKSKDFAREFIEQKQILSILLFDHLDETPPVDVRDAVKYFDEDVRSIVEDKKSGLITLSVTWIDPNVAADWANELVKRANQRLRAQALRDAERNIRYLQGEIAATTVNAVQVAIGKVVESEMQKLLLARGSEEYAFKVIDKAVAPKKRIKPKRLIVILGATMAGAFLSIVSVLIASWWAGQALRRRL